MSDPQKGANDIVSVAAAFAVWPAHGGLKPKLPCRIHLPRGLPSR
jgi:hypothetical protein